VHGSNLLIGLSEKNEIFIIDIKDNLKIISKFIPHHDDLYSVCELSKIEDKFLKVPHIFSSGSEPLANTIKLRSSSEAS